MSEQTRVLRPKGTIGTVYDVIVDGRYLGEVAPTTGGDWTANEYDHARGGYITGPWQTYDTPQAAARSLIR